MTYNNVFRFVTTIVVGIGFVLATNNKHSRNEKKDIQRLKKSLDENNTTKSIILQRLANKLIKKRNNVLNSRQRRSLLDDNIDRYVVKYKNKFGRQAALNAASKIYHDFKNDEYVAIDLSIGSMELLQVDMNIESIELDSYWTEDGILEQVIDPTKFDEFFQNTTSMVSINSTKILKNGRTLQQKEQIPYGINMINTISVSYGVHKSMVCIVDTGVTYWHPDLQQTLMSGASRKQSSTGATLTWSTDKRGHGTHVAGIINAKSNNNYGVRGVGNIPLYITRGLGDDGTARESDIREAIEQCDTAGAKVISLSLSGTSITTLMKKLLDRLYAKNIIIVAAAGNDGKRIGNYPASYPNVISVGAVQSDETIWKNSNYGPWLELTAPGVSILSTGVDKKGQYTFILYSGTSMATPHVAGAAALLMSHWPKCSATQIRYALAKTAKDKGNKGCDDYYGYGIINVRAAYDYLKKNTCVNANWGKSVGNGMCSITSGRRRLGETLL
jgi:serine protease